ncbi:phosphatase PAP2 family protein [Actimicrobium sp. CCI2.3]|uniref:phosphatase PAP2 family protein n=1 Tax=Actimicrobium sp. CCI2.3 TaxID=3048616 RepID=UPI002AB5C4F7|nr:phosphatase PAP2 family protein [Actimicrobium sp. CCI2.3]MDY7576460.1 phosphatase PAP2 family protein [Actimicrobium sp. CCI2.3]
MNGEAWRPYQPTTFPTPPFAEHTSGHSAFSSAGAEVLKQFTGSDVFGSSYTQAARTLKLDPTTPAQDVKLEWATFTAAAEEAGMSRLYGGIHFSNGDLAGREIGRKVGAQVFAKAQSYWLGKA